MSLDVYVQRFLDGDAAGADGEVLRGLIAPYVARTGPDSDFAELHFDDGSADLHGFGDPGSGFMVNHVTGEAAWALPAELGARGDMTVMPVGVPPMVFSDEARTHLPEGLADEAILVTSGAEILRTIREA